MASKDQPLVLLADDDADVLRVMTYHLQTWNYRVLGVPDRDTLLHQLERETPGVLLLDLQLGATDGLQLLPQILQRWPGLPVVMLTAHGSIDSAVTAIKQGAFDFLTKPPDLARMQMVLRHATERKGLSERIRKLEELVEEPSGSARMWGESQAMRQLHGLLQSVAPTDATVLVLGESGTGKELVARAIHEMSTRARGPFVAVNMAALPRELAESTLFGHEKGSFTGAVQAQLGCCEAAEGGTLFLDEIGEMDMALQAKLLRFLQERTINRVGSTRPRVVNVRVVAATNRDLLQQVTRGNFREDLYYRLNVVPVHLPPLRDRREDVPLLATRFLHRLAVKYQKPATGFSPEAMTLLERYDWPGNVRQLENLIERLVILCQETQIPVTLLPAEIRKPTPARPEGADTVPVIELPPLAAGSRSEEAPLRPIDEMEKNAIREALKQSGGNVREAARLLGLGQATVYRKIKRYDLSPELIAREAKNGVT
ncbi:MAG: sigma-54 dependent transcriptional regulator [Gemmataceae bacterium]